MSGPGKQKGKRQMLKVQGKIKRETAKAILVSAEADTPCGQTMVDVWFPKSRIEVIDGAVCIDDANAWLIEAKNCDAAADKFPGGNAWVEIQVVDTVADIA